MEGNPTTGRPMDNVANIEIQRLNAVTFQQGIDLLIDVDPVLSRVIASHKICLPSAAPLNFGSLVRVITNQQLSGAAAKTIYRRVVDCCDGEITAQVLTTIKDKDLQRCGLSRPKITYLRDAQKRVLGESSFLDDLCYLDSEAAIARLSEIKGIGAWSAAILLLFNDQRLDVFPPGDATLSRAIVTLFPGEQHLLDRIVDRWKPYRSVASICLWSWVDNGSPT